MLGQTWNTKESSIKKRHYIIKYHAGLWEVVGADIFMINGKTLLCITNYHSKFPMAKKVNSLLADDLGQMTKLIFAE